MIAPISDKLLAAASIFVIAGGSTACNSNSDGFWPGLIRLPKGVVMYYRNPYIYIHIYAYYIILYIFYEILTCNYALR